MKQRAGSLKRQDGQTLGQLTRRKVGKPQMYKVSDEKGGITCRRDQKTIRTCFKI